MPARDRGVLLGAKFEPAHTHTHTTVIHTSASVKHRETLYCASPSPVCPRLSLDSTQSLHQSNHRSGCASGVHQPQADFIATKLILAHVSKGIRQQTPKWRHSTISALCSKLCCQTKCVSSVGCDSITCSAAKSITRNDALTHQRQGVPLASWWPSLVQQTCPGSHCMHETEQKHGTGLRNCSPLPVGITTCPRKLMG